MTPLVTMHGAVKTSHALALLALVGLGLIASAIEPYDWLTWWLEVAPVILAVPLVALCWKRFPLTSLAASLIALHAGILMLGGHYTYARVPLGEWTRELLALERNPYDRLGHVAQGFVPAVVAREILLRRSPLAPGTWLFFLVLCVVLAISAGYELLEWAAAMWQGSAADDFLGTQGDPWDTQWDMFLALCGGAAAQLGLARLHDRQLARLKGR